MASGSEIGVERVKWEMVAFYFMHFFSFFIHFVMCKYYLDLKIKYTQKFK